MRTLIILFLLSSFHPVNGQINFFNLYTDNGDDFGEGIVQLEDSSYVITGSSSSFGWGSTDAFLLKIDSLGNYLWSKNYGGPESDGGKRVMYNPGDGFYVAGTTNSFGNGAYDFYLFKTDLSGNLLWERTYGGSGWERLNDAVLTNDGGIVMVGENASNSTDNKDGYIVKTDLTGDTLWTQIIGTPQQDDYLNTVKTLNDSVFITAGTIYSADSSDNRVFFYSKNHLNNQSLWVDTLHTFSSAGIDDIVINQNSLFSVGTSFKNGNYSHFLLNIDLTTFNLLNSNNIGGAGDQYGLNIIYDTLLGHIKSDYNYLTSSSIQNSLDYALRRYNNSLSLIPGNIVAIAHPGIDQANQIIHTNDGGFVLVGITDSEFIHPHHVFVCKIGPNNASPVITVPHNEIPLVSLTEASYSNVKVYPNPTSDKLNISGDFDQLESVSIIDLKGKTLIQSNTHSLDVSKLNSGVYVVSINTNKGTARKRLVIQ